MLYPVAARGCLAVELICVAFVARTRFSPRRLPLSSRPGFAWALSIPGFVVF